MTEERSGGPEQRKALAAAVIARLERAGHEAFLVGGCVRDLLMGAEPEDYDVVTSASPDAVQALFARTVPLGVRFGVILVIEDGHPFEVATYRADEEYVDGRRPSRVRFAGAREDVLRRDFTVNGLLMDPGTGRIMDHVGGLADLDARIIRTIGDPDTRFGEDHLRLLRAIRFAATLTFTIDPATFAAIRRHAAEIDRISGERIREELTRIAISRGARRGMEMLAASGLLGRVLPEVEALIGLDQPPAFHPEGDVWEHVLRMLDFLPRADDGRADVRLAWAALLHDTGKAVTQSADERGVHFYGHVGEGVRLAEGVLRRLRFSNQDMEGILEMIRRHMHFVDIYRMKPGTLKRFLRIPDFPLHLELHRLDCLASHGRLDSYEFCRAKLAELTTEDLHPERLIGGRELIEMGFAPGPLFRQILEEVEDAQLGGSIGTPEEARRLVLERFGTSRVPPSA